MNDQEKKINELTKHIDFLLREVRFLSGIINRLDKEVDDLERRQLISIEAEKQKEKNMA